MMVTSAFGGGVAFPASAGTKARSPDGNWLVTCYDPTDNKAENGHLLLLKSSNASFELRRFNRACDVLWSSDSCHVAITDWLGSNLSDVFIYSTSDPPKSKSLRDLFPSDTIRAEELKGHCYFEASKWIDSHRLRIRVFGHTDEGHSYSFQHKYIFDVETGAFELDGKRSPNQRLQAIPR